MNIPRTYKEMEYYSLTDKDIKELFPNTNIMTYTELNDINHIDEIFGEDGSCFLLYLTSGHYGHWCLLFKNDDKVINYFNSYGTEPDQDLLKIPKDALYEFDQDSPILFELLADSGYHIQYNDKQLQSRAEGISTCGSHCVTRLMNRDKTATEYIKVLKKYKKPADLLVAIVTGYNLFGILS